MDFMTKPFTDLLDLAAYEIPLAVQVLIFIFLVYFNFRTDRQLTRLTERIQNENEESIKRVEYFYKEQIDELKRRTNEDL